MKIKRLLLSIFVLVVAVSLWSCKKDPKPEPFTPTAIATVLQEATNNQDVKVEGVVYGVIKNGFYIADSELGRVFVVMGSSWTPNVEVGDKVQLEAQFSYIANFPQIKNVKEVKVASKSNSLPITKSASSVTAIKSKDKTQRTGVYGAYVELVATVGKNTANMYTLTDDDGNAILVYDQSNVSVLQSFLDKRVTLPVILHNYSVSENEWQVSFAGTASSITETPLSFDEVVEKALQDIEARVPREIFGALELPTRHSLNSFITYSWEVVPNDYVTINQNGQVTVTLSETDQEVTLKVTISDGTESRTVDYVITSKAITERTVTDLNQNTPEVNMSTVIVRGVVVAIARNQSLSLRSFILQDPETKETCSVDFGNSGEGILNSSDEFKAIQLGDEIVVTGKYRLTGRPTIMNVTKMEVLSSGNECEHDFENAFVLKDAESYEAFGEDIYPHLNKLVKFENPFVNFSTSSTPADTNWVRLGYDETSPNAGHGPVGSRINYAFLIAAQNESLGSENWYKVFDIPFVNQPAIQLQGTIYAYAMYVSDSYLAFVIPDWGCWQFSKQLTIENELGQNIPDSIEEGAIVLPTTHELVTGDVVWTSSHPEVVDPVTGTVYPVEENTEVTLTATYTYDGVEYQSTYKVVVRAQVVLTVSQVLATMNDGDIVKVKGVIAGYSSDGNNSAVTDGIILIDNETGEMLLVNGMKNMYPGSAYGAYLDSQGHALAIGDEIILVGKYLHNAAGIGSSGAPQTGRKHIDLNIVGSSVHYESTVGEIHFDFENALVIDSTDDLQSLADNLQYGKLIKFVGTKETPVYIGGSSNSAPFNVKVFLKLATDNNGTKYNGLIFSFKTDVNIPNAGANWWFDIFDIEKPFIGPSTTIPAIPCEGEIYAVVCAMTGTYYQMSIVAVEESTIRRVYTPEQFEAALDAKVPDAFEEGPFTLPLNTRHTPQITWTSSNPSIINIETMTVAKVTTNTQVTLTATYVFEGVEYSTDLTVTVMAPPPAEPLTVGEVLANGVSGVEMPVRGLVVGFQSDGTTSGTLRGIILMDKTTKDIILVDGMENTPNSAAYPDFKDKDGRKLAIGDEITLVDVTYTVGDFGRISLLATASTVISTVSTGNEITWDTSKAIVIDSNEDMIAFAQNPQFGVLIKFVGTESDPFYFGGSSSTPSSVNYKFLFNKEAVNNNGTKYEGQTFSFKKTVNDANLGVGWWETYFDLPEAFIAPDTNNPKIGYTGTIYAVLNSRTGTYWQLSFVNPSGLSVSKLS
ncbi:MAG TPA: hypothetical protein PK840_02375 [Bacilli bacterium]|nr:hypothetical protein [Bacilli bacterium]